MRNENMYRNLECDNEKIYRWHVITDEKRSDNPISRAIIKEVRENIYTILTKIEGITAETIKEIMDGYIPHFNGIQTIQCPSCKHLQVDVIIDEKTKLREDLWRAYETDRVIKQLLGGTQ